MTRALLRGLVAFALAMFVVFPVSAGTHSRGAHYDLSDKSLHGGGTVTGDIIFSGACASFQDSGTNDGFVCCADGCYGLQRGADEDPTNIVLSSEDAWSQATVNTSGGDLVLAAGLGRRLITVADYTLGSTDTVTLTVNGADTTLTEGTDWDCTPTSNDACATALATAIDTAAVGVDATASSAVVYLDKVAGSYVRTVDITIADGGVDGAFGTATEGDDGTIVCDHDLSNVGTIYFNTDPDHTHVEGAMAWDPDDKTLHLDTEVTGTALQIGQEIYLRATNKTGAQLDNGTVVYIDSAQGSRPTVAKADADLSAEACKTIGLTTHDIANNGTGYVTTYGLVRDIDTSSWSAGDVLYLSSTAGTMTNVRPSIPAHSIRIGYVVFSNASEGIVFVSTLLNAGVYTAVDASGADTMTFSHDGTDGVITSQAGNVNIVSAGGSISMSDDDVTDVGSVTSGTANAASTGFTRAANTECHAWRNAANDADLSLCADGSDNLTYGGDEVTLATGTPVDNQVAVWTAATTVEGDANFTWTGTALAVNGGVGINKSPSYALHVYESIKNQLSVFESGDQYAIIGFADNSTTGYGYVTIGADGDDMMFYAGNNRRMTIDATGKVGINDDTPDDTLDVNGNALVTSLTTQTANPASTGFLRGANTEGLYVRNAANSADESITLDASDSFVVTAPITVDTGAQWKAGSSVASIILQETGVAADNVCLATSGDNFYVYQGDCSTLTTISGSTVYLQTAAGGSLNLDDTTPTGDANGTANIYFRADDSASNLHTMARIEMDVTDATSGSEAADLVFYYTTPASGASVEALRLDGSASTATATAFSSATANPASTGALRVANTEGLYARNAANDGDESITLDASDIWQISSDTTITGTALATTVNTATLQATTSDVLLLANSAGTAYWSIVLNNPQIVKFRNQLNTDWRTLQGGSIHAVTGDLQAKGKINWDSSRSAMTSPADGQVAFADSAGTTGATLDTNDVADTVVVKDLAGTGAGYLQATAYSSTTANPASTGALRVANTEGLYARNAGNDGDESIVLNASDSWEFSTDITVPTYELCIVPPSGILTGPAAAPSPCVNDLGDGAGDDTGAIGGLCFDSSSTDIVYYNWEIPDCWDGASDMAVKVYYTTSDGNAMDAGEGVTWAVTYREMVDGTDALNSRTAQTVTENYTSSAGDADGTTFVEELTIDYDASGTVLDAGDTMYGSLFRDHDDADDDYAHDALQYRAEICFQSTTPTCDHQ